MLAISDYTYVLGGGQVLMADTPVRLSASREFTESSSAPSRRARNYPYSGGAERESCQRRPVTSSRRLRTPNLSKAAVRCSWTVLAEMCNSWTIWRVECPLITRATTRDWASVRPYALSSSELICVAGGGFDNDTDLRRG